MNGGAGHYVPQLGVKILEGNKKAHRKDRIKLKGIMIALQYRNNASEGRLDRE